MRGIAIVAAAAAMPWVAAGAAAAAMPSTASHLSAIEVFNLAGKLSEAGQIAAAAKLYDALARDPDPEIRAEARFRKGMMYAAAKHYEQAAEAFRALLNEKPDAARVRLELARVLAAMGDESGARKQLRQAEASGLPPDVAVTVDQFARTIRSPKRFGGSIRLAIAPDSNINRATQSRTLDTVIAPIVLSRDARATSGVGLDVSGQTFAKFGVADDLSIVPRLSGSADLYREHEFNDISGVALLGLEWRRGKDKWSPAAGHSWRWFGNAPYVRSWVGSLEWLHPLGKRGQIVVSGSASATHYLRNPLQSGALYSLTATIDRALDVRTGAEITLSATRQTARDPGYATASGGVSLLGWRDLGAATIFASAGVTRTEGDARLFLFPERRREWLAAGRLGATLRRFSVHGFAPTASIAYERNFSTVGLYDYRRIAATFGIVRSF